MHGPATATRPRKSTPPGGIINQGPGSFNLACSDLNVNGPYYAGSATLNQLLDVNVGPPDGRILGQSAQCFVSGS